MWNIISREDVTVTQSLADSVNYLRRIADSPMNLGLPYEQYRQMRCDSFTDAVQTINALVDLVGDMHGAIDATTESSSYAYFDGRVRARLMRALTKAQPIAALAKEKL